MAPSKKTPISKGVKLKSLTKKRANILGAAEQIEKFNNSYQPSIREDQIVVRLQHLEQLWDDFNIVQEEIELLEDEEEYSDTRSDFQDRFYELKGSLKSKVASKNPQPSPA